MVSVISTLWLLLVLLCLAPQLYHLPRAVLSSVIVVNLRSMFRLYPVAFNDLYRTRRYSDFTLFLITNISVLCLGLDTGLYIALATELFIVYFRLRSSTQVAQVALKTVDG